MFEKKNVFQKSKLRLEQKLIAGTIANFLLVFTLNLIKLHKR